MIRHTTAAAGMVLILVASLAAAPRQVQTVGTFKHPIVSLAFSHDGKRLATGSGFVGELRTGGKVNVWRLSDGEAVARFVTEGPAYSVCFSQDDDTLASATLRRVSTYNLSGHKVLGIVDDGERDWRHAALMPDGRTVLAISHAGFGPHGLYAWDTHSREGKRRIEGEFTSLAMSPDGKVLLLGDGHGQVHVVDPATWQVRKVLGERRGGRSVTVLAISPEGRLALAWMRKGQPAVYDLQSGEVVAQVEGAYDELHDAAFSPDGRTLALAGDDLVLVDPATGKVKSRTEAHTRGVMSVTYSPDGKHLATGGNYDTTVILWSLD